MNEMQKLTRIVGGMNYLYHEASFRLGQSNSSMVVLYTLLGTEENCSISDIRRLTGLRKQTLNSALRKLERDGLIRLEKGTGKSKTVHLTDKGRTVAEQSAGRLIHIENEAVKDWSEEEIRTYLELSQRFLDSFQALVMELPDGTGK